MYVLRHPSDGTFVKRSYGTTPDLDKARTFTAIGAAKNAMPYPAWGSPKIGWEIVEVEIRIKVPAATNPPPTPDKDVDDPSGPPPGWLGVT